MTPRWAMLLLPAHCFLFTWLQSIVVLGTSLSVAENNNNNAEYCKALVNVTVLDPGVGPLFFRIHGGRYGIHSPKVEAKGLVLAPQPICGVAERLGCDPQTRFLVPPNTKFWIALLQRGNCTFKEKILRAVSHNATAVVIYNNVSKEEAITMTHQGTGEIVTIMITEVSGKKIMSYVERNISVLIAIAVGPHSSSTKNFSSGSPVFVSIPYIVLIISFIVLMIISSAWLIFYFIQKIRYKSAQYTRVLSTVTSNDSVIPPNQPALMQVLGHHQ